MENIDWKNLPFGYMKTNYNIRCYYRDGKWGELEISSSEIINIHMSATSMHYGQEIFEGLKAFKGKDGQIRVFRWQENAKRMRDSANGLLMAEVPEEIFEKQFFQQSNLTLNLYLLTIQGLHYTLGRLKLEQAQN
jgi:branched-chain amino acid aminotransferase